MAWSKIELIQYVADEGEVESMKEMVIDPGTTYGVLSYSNIAVTSTDLVIGTDGLGAGTIYMLALANTGTNPLTLSWYQDGSAVKKYSTIDAGKITVLSGLELLTARAPSVACATGVTTTCDAWLIGY